MTGGDCHTILIGEINITDIARRRAMANRRGGGGGDTDKALTSNGNYDAKLYSAAELSDKEKDRVRRLSVKRA